MPYSTTPTGIPAGPRYMSGNIAAAEGALAAKCSFYAGYPITPSSEIMEVLAGSYRAAVAPSSRWRTRSPPSRR